MKVRETLPDRIVELADEIEVVDLPPEALLQRFRDGKVYFPPKADQAMQRFFRKGNLLGLREMALRYAARKVDEDMRSYMESHGIIGPWPAGSRLLVCISTSPLSERLIRTGQRMAADLDAEWFAVYVESPREAPSTEAAKDQLSRNLRLARELGARVEVLIAQNIAEEIHGFAQEHNVTLIIVGLPRSSLYNRWLRGSVVNEVISQSGQIHVLVIGGTENEQKKEARHRSRGQRKLAAVLWQPGKRSGDVWLLLDISALAGPHQHRHDSTAARNLQRNDLGQALRLGGIASGRDSSGFLLCPARVYSGH